MRWHYDFRPADLSIVIALLVLTTGCSSGPPKGEVSGKVTFKGQPVKEGTVRLLNLKEGGSYEAPIGGDGSFAIPGGVALGEYTIEVIPLSVMVDSDPGKTPPALVEKAAPDVPKKYRMQGTTPLKETVKAGKNELKLDMKP